MAGRRLQNRNPAKRRLRFQTHGRSGPVPHRKLEATATAPPTPRGTGDPSGLPVRPGVAARRSGDLLRREDEAGAWRRSKATGRRG